MLLFEVWTLWMCDSLGFDHRGQLHRVLWRWHRTAANPGQGLSWASTSNLMGCFVKMQLKGDPNEETFVFGAFYFYKRRNYLGNQELFKLYYCMSYYFGFIMVISCDNPSISAHYEELSMFKSVIFNIATYHDWYLYFYHRITWYVAMSQLLHSCTHTNRHTCCIKEGLITWRWPVVMHSPCSSSTQRNIRDYRI